MRKFVGLGLTFACFFALSGVCAATNGGGLDAFPGSFLGGFGDISYTSSTESLTEEIFPFQATFDDSDDDSSDTQFNLNGEEILVSPVRVSQLTKDGPEFQSMSSTDSLEFNFEKIRHSPNKIDAVIYDMNELKDEIATEQKILRGVESGIVKQTEKMISDYNGVLDGIELKINEAPDATQARKARDCFLSAMQNFNSAVEHKNEMIAEADKISAELKELAINTDKVITCAEDFDKSKVDISTFESVRRYADKIEDIQFSSAIVNRAANTTFDLLTDYIDSSGQYIETFQGYINSGLEDLNNAKGYFE